MYDEIIEWSVLEYQYKEKRTDWYVAFAIASISASATSFLLGNILFGIFIIIASFTLAMHSVKKPDMINIKIDGNGILVNNDIYKYGLIKSFWVETENKNSKVIIRLDKMFMSYVVIPLGEMPSQVVNDFLLQYLEKMEYKEPIFHKIVDYLGF